MKEIVNFNVDEISPQRDRILNLIGVPAGAKISEGIETAMLQALNHFNTLAKPTALWKEITISEFRNVFYGDGKNEIEVALKLIYPKAARLALFALTMGADISSETGRFFSENDFPVASLLDAAASIAADNSVAMIEDQYCNFLNQHVGRNGFVVLGYSPGYCGWDISGQKKLFQYLQPEKIGITLNDSYLMTPLKSVTGVLVYGEKEIHIFENKFRYCRDCRDRTCVERMNKLIGEG
ncbi:MAG: hypothetical protein A2V66_07390 [Ignavibacteria bacterium RBG_13_36_8]|nr:MAG: hypothetical protein A2V66_07390 [Ignavibacteria bacterium RBG_13_36_8]